MVFRAVLSQSCCVKIVLKNIVMFKQSLLRFQFTVMLYCLDTENDAGAFAVNTFKRYSRKIHSKDLN